MASNPFDQFDVSDSGNPFDQFDSEDLPSQIPGVQRAVPYHDDSTVLDKAIGVGEAGINAATGLPASIAGSIAGLVAGKGEKEQNEIAAKVMDKLSYSPRTEKGKDYSENVGEFVNRNMVPLMGGIGHFTVPEVLRKADVETANKVMDRQKELDAAKEEVKPQSNPFDQFDDSTQQMELLPPDNQGKTANPFEAQHGTWAVDENGMPVRTDISMEAANLENPLQRNLWGDELPPRETPVGQAATLPMDRDILGHEQLSGQDVSPDSIGITQAMDKTRDTAMNADELPAAVEARDNMQMQIDSLSHAVDAGGELKSAMMDSEVMTPRSPFTDASISSMGKFNRQRGAIDLKAIRDAFWKSDDKYLEAFKGTFDPRAWTDLQRDIKNKSPDTVVGFLSPREFHTVANLRGASELADAPRLHEKIRAGLNSEKGLLEVPELWVKVQNGVAKVIEHEGRHRMDVFRQMEVNKVPVRIRIKETDGSKPTTLQAQWTNSPAAATVFPERIGGSGGPRVPLSQRGAVGDLNPGKRARTIIDDIRDRYSKEHDSKAMIPENPDPKEVVQAALKEGKDSKQFKYTESGATLAAMKRGSAAVQAAARIVQNAVKAADYNIRKMVFPVEKAFRSLNKTEIETLANVMKQEMLSGKRFDPKALEALSLKQQVAYAHMRAMFEDTLRIQNEARAAKGQAPITEMEAYLSSRWIGDFRRPVFQAVLDKAGNPVINKDGTLQRKLVYYLAADTKHGLEKQWKALQEKHPDFAYDPKEDHVVRYYKRETDLQSAYSTILDILGDDPQQREAVNLITKALQEQTVNEAASFLGQEKHFKEKAGIRGFVGDRPGTKAVPESLAMFQQQIQYAKNAYKWSEMQKAGESIKGIVSDKDLVRQQPNNVQYIKEYYKQNVGYGEAVAVSHLEDSIRNLGISPSVLNRAVGSMKSYFILQKLAVNTGYTVANILQTSNILPHLLDLQSQGFKGNFLKAVPMGIAGGIAMATTHFSNMIRGKSATFLGTPEGAFLNKAFKYAEDNGVTARALYDEAPIHTAFSKVGQAANALGKTMSLSEAFVRSMSYMTFVQFLKDSGKFTKDIDIFQKADELTNAALVDYRRGERPMMFEKLGTAGNFLNTLQTYPVNWYNQWNYFGRQAAKGNVAPLLSAFMLQYAVAGAMGIPGFEDMTKLWDIIKNNLIPDSVYAKYRGNDFFVDPKMWMVKNFGDSSVYGWLSDKSGIGLTSRVNAPGAGQMLTSPAGPIADIYKQGKNWVGAALDPTNKTKLAQAAMSSVPPGLQGALEQAPFMKGATFEERQGPDGQPQRVYQRPGDIESHTGVVTRSPKEEMLRNFGLRSQRETVERELGYRVHDQERVDQQKLSKIPAAIYDAAKRGDKDSVRDLYEAYVKLTGQEPSPTLFDTAIQRSTMTSFERAATAAKSVTQLKDVARMKAILKEVSDEHKSGRNQ